MRSVSTPPQRASALKAAPRDGRLVGAMSFFDLCVAVLLFFNAAAILNEHRFLAKRACPGARCGGPRTLARLRLH